MSAFVCLLDRSGGALAPEALDHLTEALALHGRTWCSHCQGPVGVAIPAPPTPVSGRRDPPLAVDETGLVVGIAGRVGFATRDATRGSTGGSTSGGSRWSGAASWALANDLPSNPRRLAELSGRFALVAADPDSEWVMIARDHLGAVGVFYHLDSRWLIAASEPAPILRHEAVSAELDERSVAGFLGLQFRHGERSVFREVRELPPAHWMRVSSRETHRERYWSFSHLETLEAPSSDEIETEFRSRLRQSLSLEIGELDPSRVALSLSGGLDSTALAALVPDGVRAFSWIFDELPDADERDAIRAVSRHLGLPVHWVKGDGLFPFSEGYVERFVSISSPHLNPFAALKAGLYDAARKEGCERILVGDAGDALYAARDYWLRDLIASAGPRSFGSVVSTLGGALRGEAWARGALRRLVPFRRLWRRFRSPRIPWLTAEARSHLPPESPSPILPRPLHRHELAVSAKHTELEREEQRVFLRYGIERGNPYWSWPLLELTLRLPATWYRVGSRTKVLTREALRGSLPEEVLESERRGLLGSLFLRGIEKNRSWLRDRVFDRPRSDWQRYVDRPWVEPFLSETDGVEIGHTVLWYVISYELWYRRLLEE